MLELKKIYSMNSSQPSWLIVNEWEKIIATKLNIPIINEKKISKFIKFRLDKYDLSKLYSIISLNNFKSCGKLRLRYIMTANKKTSCFIDKNTIPIFIDFWITEDDLPLFYKVNKHVPLIIVTNREIYNLLKRNNCPIPFEHWPLSWPDTYPLAKHFYKKYEFGIFGRTNPYFERLLNEYSKKYPDFSYIKSDGDINNRKYITNKGEFIANDTGRNSYFKIIQQTKISCYSTPGIDEGKKISSHYNQVTPRLFEMLSNSCHVIGHYPLSDDVKWYNLQSIVPNVNSYEEFERVLNSFRNTEFNVDKINCYLKQHLTSNRIKILKAILAKHHIIIKT